MLENARKISCWHTATVQGRDVGFVPHKPGHRDRDRIVDTAHLQRHSTVADEAQGCESQSRNSRGFEGVIGSAALCELLHLFGQTSKLRILWIRGQDMSCPEAACLFQAGCS